MQAPQTEQQLSSDEAEAFIGQEGVEGLDGEVIDDLDGEGTRARSWRSWLTNAAWGSSSCCQRQQGSYGAVAAEAR